MMGDAMVERAWSLHCSGMAVPDIAKKMGREPDDVRSAITGRWAELSDQAHIDGKLSERKGW